MSWDRSSMSVKYHGRRVGFGTPAPQVTRRRHETPYAGDTQSAIIRASGGCLDVNLGLIKFKGRPLKVPVTGHWPQVGRNGFTHWKPGPKQPLKKLTAAQKKMTMQAWVDHHGGTIHALNMLRKRGGGKRKRPINDYPLTWGQAVAFADRCNTVLTPEVKDTEFANRLIAKSMAEVCGKHDYPLWPMALLKMRKCKEKCEAFTIQNLEFALIFGKFRAMARGTNKIKGWEHKPTVIWGPASARQWLKS